MATTIADVNEFTAHALNDNYQIVMEETGRCIGVEHNETEAKAIAKWRTHNTGCTHVVIRNTPDVVRAAKKILPNPIRAIGRDEILKEMKVY